MTNAISRILPEELMLLNGAHATNKDVLVTTRAVSARHKLNSSRTCVRCSLLWRSPFRPGTPAAPTVWILCVASTATVCTTRRFRTTRRAS